MNKKYNNFYQLRTIICVNCGAITDMTEKWFNSEDVEVRCYIFDNHRPIHHENVYS